MKIRLLPLIIAAVAIAASPCLRADGQLVPSVSQVKAIVLHGTNLELSIFQNGSGSLVYGVGKNAQIPRKTFSMENVYRILTPSTGNTGSQVKTIGLQQGTFYGPNYRFYVNDEAIIEKILSQAGVRLVRERS